MFENTEVFQSRPYMIENLEVLSQASCLLNRNDPLFLVVTRKNVLWTTMSSELFNKRLNLSSY